MKKLSPEDRKAFIEDYLARRAAGGSQRGAYAGAKEQAFTAGRDYPPISTLMNWIDRGVNPAPAPAPVAESAPETPEKASPAAQDAPEAVTPSDGYVKALEAIVRLYRRRSEADVDAVCDTILPGLFTEEA